LKLFALTSRLRRLVRKKKHRHVAEIKSGVARFEVFAGNDRDLAGRGLRWAGLL